VLYTLISLIFGKEYNYKKLLVQVITKFIFIRYLLNCVLTILLNKFDTPSQIELYDIYGKQIRLIKSVEPIYVLKSDNLISGLYLLVVKNDSNISFSEKISYLSK
jgi:hypothetical protein